ncbi:MAG: phosphoglucosamine mutase [Alphaproteobacteria bacterium]|nr:phosphoglucosamine mutase [Alphaproteobacteria bacterium]
MYKLFGTDGIRGRSNGDAMTVELALKIGMAAGLYFKRGDHRHRVVIGKDTRLSGYMIESALVAGFTSVGVDVFLLGPLPTPAVAMLTRSLRADIGVMISASHNPYYDNGLKLFGPDGCKLSNEVEGEIESLFCQDLSSRRAAVSDIGRARRVDDEQGRYIEFVKHVFPRHLSLEGLRIVVDCANGAAYKVAPAALWELGAEVIAINDKPNGLNINEQCGSTSPAGLCREVCADRADIGIGLDGDGDRLIIVDEKGNVIAGDHLIGLIADSWHKSGRLSSGGVVATVMSNLGLERFLKRQGLALERTAVGDRHILEHMRRCGYNLGGEQSGHIILSDFSTTGDGLVAALQILSMVVEKKMKVSELCGTFDLLPQVLRNIQTNNVYLLEDDRVRKAIEAGNRRLCKNGRLLVRRSGTEPLIRVMAEGDDKSLIQEIVEDIAVAIELCA